MKRPPSRTSSRTAKSAPKLKREVLRKESKRLRVHEKTARNSVVQLRPRVNFGKRVLLSVLGSVLTLVVLVFIAVLSPLLAVKEIEVVGANRVSASSILKDLNSLKGKPLPQITSEELASKLSKYQLIDSVSAVALPPSKLRVVVVERTAIAIVQINGIDYLYDAAGVQLGRATASDRLPTIEQAGNPATSKTFDQAISVLLSIPVDLLPRVNTVVALSKDNVVLHLRTYGQKVLWGDSSDPGLKAKVLSALMNHYAKHYGRTFDVSAPNQPSVY